MRVTRTNNFTCKKSSMEIPNLTPEQLGNYYAGDTCIQAALPHLTDDEREFILTGMTPEEWDAITKEIDDE